MSLRWSKVVHWSSLRHLSYDSVQEKFWLSQRAHIHLAALRWTFSRADLCFCRWGDNTGTENSRQGLTSARYVRFFTVREQFLRFLLRRFNTFVAFRIAVLTWSSHLSLRSMTTPRYLKESTHSKGELLRVYVHRRRKHGCSGCWSYTYIHCSFTSYA